MDGLLGGYGSDASGSEGEGAGVVTGALLRPVARAGPDAVAAPAAPALEGAVAAGPGTAKRRKVDYSKLPFSRPLDASAAALAGDSGEAPLRRAAELDAARQAAGRSLLASLPAPKVTLGADLSQGGGGGGVRIDLGGLVPRREKPTVVVADVLRRDGAPDLVEEEEEAVPQNMANHPMFSQGLKADGPSQEDLQFLRREPKFIKIQADDMKDPDWYMKNQIAGGPGLHKGKKVPEEASMYESTKWKSTTHADPSRIQKRKHQINWLAQEAMENEAELIDRNSSGRLTKAQTSLKYGW